MRLRRSAVPAAYRPAVDPADRRVGIVHLGIGAFHRAHQAVYTEDCGDWGIAGVTQRGNRVRDQLVPQDGLYTVLVPDGDAPAARVIGAVREVLSAVDDPAAVPRRIADPGVRVVSLTVTEKGYRHDPATGRLRADDPELAADMAGWTAGRPPRTVLGQLVGGLLAREAAGAGAVTVLCCDNLPANGRTLHGLVRQYAAALPGGDRLVDRIDALARFPDTVVDRIVPATTDDDRATARRLLGGLDDEGVVVTEPFSQWVIADDFATAPPDRPAFEDAGARLVPDVAPYQLAKLRVLNGGHSALAYLGGLAGHGYIADAATDEDLAGYLRALMTEDLLPTLPAAAMPGTDLAEYAATVRGRFGKRALRHRTAQVGMDGSQKLPQRLLDPIRERRAAGTEPRRATLAVAAWMRHVWTGRDETGGPFPPDDPMLPTLTEKLAGADSPAAVAAALLSVRAVFGDLADDAAWRAELVDQLDVLTRAGARAAARAVS